MKNWSRTVTITLLLFTAFGAFYGGFFFMMDPTGKLMHMSTYPLMTSPFLDYFYPGLILFCANGVLPLTAAIATWKKTTYCNYLIILQGLVLLGWIVIQVSMLQIFNPLHLTMALIGVTLTVLGGVALMKKDWAEN